MGKVQPLSPGVMGAELARNFLIQTTIVEEVNVWFPVTRAIKMKLK
jgi:ABC-type anion transport system duplicated permease subunit